MILMSETITAKDLNDEIQTWENEVIECLMLNKRQWYVWHRHALSWKKWYEALDVQYSQPVVLNLEEACQTYSEAMLIFDTYTADSSNDDMLSWKEDFLQWDMNSLICNWYRANKYHMILYDQLFMLISATAHKHSEYQQLLNETETMRQKITK